MYSTTLPQQTKTQPNCVHSIPFTVVMAVRSPQSPQSRNHSFYMHRSNKVTRHYGNPSCWRRVYTSPSIARWSFFTGVFVSVWVRVYRCVCHDVIRSHSKSNFEIDIFPSMFQSQRQQKFKIMEMAMAMLLIYSIPGPTSGKTFVTT